MELFKRHSLLLRLLAATILFTVTTAAALPTRRSVAVGAGNLQTTGISSAVNLTSREISPITLSVPITKSQVVHITLSKERKFNGLQNSSVKRILQGHATFSSRGKKQRMHSRLSAASLVVVAARDGTHHLHGVVETLGSKSLQRRDALITLQGTLQPGRDSAVLLKGGGKRPATACGTVPSKISRAIASEPGHSQAEISGFKQIEILLEGDEEFFSSAGSAAVTELTQIVSLADVIYRRDLNLTFLPTIVTSAVPYSSVFRYNEDFELDFFNEMRSKRPSLSQDIYAVITGKTPPEPSLTNTAGIANDIGITCQNSSFSQTAIRRFSDFPSGVFYTFAHEVGHLIGGEHDDSLSGNPSVGYIMNSGTQNVSTFLENFSQFSINQISQYFASNGSCLVDVGDAPPAVAPPQPTPTPTPEPEQSLFLEAELQTVSGKSVPVFYLFDGDTPVSRASVQVYKLGRAVKLATTLRTRVDGSAAYKRATKGRYYAVLASDSSVISNVVNKKR